jgi:ectoine hydroxylase-related dioxygenase (phytanoyl-CoA dioxygenase family)
MRRNDFEGYRSERVYSLLAKSPSVARLIEHPAVLDVAGPRAAPGRVGRARAARPQAPAAPGSVAIFPGTLYHRSGANRSQGKRLGLTIQYCQPWLRQLENMMLATPPELAARYSTRIQELVGCSLIAGTFVGYVDGRHPRKLIPGEDGA